MQRGVLADGPAEPGALRSARRLSTLFQIDFSH